MYKIVVMQKKQEGAALFVALIILLALTIIGLSASQRSSLQERMASNIHSKNVAFNLAESAISAFMLEASADKPVSDLDNTMGRLYRSPNGTVNSVCYDREGNHGDCDGTLWMDKAKSAEARISGQIINRCAPAKDCPGFTNSNPVVSCALIRMTAIGTVGGKFGDDGTQSESTLVDFIFISASGGC